MSLFCRSISALVVAFGLVVFLGCGGGGDISGEDISGENDGELDAGYSDAGADAVSGDDADAAAEEDAEANDDADAADSEDVESKDADAGGEVDEWKWPCPAGHRFDDDGECIRVPTLMVLATHTLSFAAGVDPYEPEEGEVVSRMRMVGVSASSSEGDGSLPLETIDEGERCRVYGEFQGFPEVERYDAGPVTIWGLYTAPATYTVDLESGSLYAAPSGLQLPFHFDEGKELTVHAVGTEENQEPVFPAFEATMQTIEEILFEHDDIVPGEELELTWPESEIADVMRIDVETRNLGEDGISRSVVCEVLDTGSYTIPADLTQHLVADAEVNAISVQQSYTQRIEPEDSDVLIMLSVNNWVRITNL